jgi:large subunit ribosomal protein L24
MKPTKMRNLQIYRATNAIRSSQMGGILTKELRKKYGKRSIRIIEGDSVKVMRGEYKGIDGKVVKISPDSSSIAIDGIKREKSKGEKIDVYIHSSNVMITGINRDDSWRKNKLEGKTGKAVRADRPTSTEVKEKPTVSEKKLAEKQDLKAKKTVSKKKKPAKINEVKE